MRILHPFEVGHDAATSLSPSSRIIAKRFHTHPAPLMTRAATRRKSSLEVDWTVDCSFLTCLTDWKCCTCSPLDCLRVGLLDWFFHSHCGFPIRPARAVILHFWRLALIVAAVLSDIMKDVRSGPRANLSRAKHVPTPTLFVSS
jgi:hypothetical protein